MKKDWEILQGKDVSVMELLSDELLEDTYHAAITFELEPDFIHMILLEMKRRKSSNPEVERITA